jgi:NAD(P)-dependent dehydrogenase (short-subunit alcohol dehydrogenase family)
MNLHPNGKKALVTGASQGLGRSIAKTLAAERVTVFSTARNGELLDGLAREIAEDGGPVPVLFVQDFVADDGPRKTRSKRLVMSTFSLTMPVVVDRWRSMRQKTSGSKG